MAYKQSSPVDIDNLRLDGNTFSSQDTNGNISLEPNGSGAVVVPSNNLYVGSASPANPYNIAIEASTAGAMGESIQNTSVGATAAATLQIIVEPATADPYTLYNINGAATFSTGIDNSDSDQFKITTGSSPSGGTTAINITTAGVVTLPGGALDVPSGGTGATTLTDHGVLLGSGTSAITALGAMTDGQLVIGSTGLDPVVASLTAGTNITITPGAGSISIAAAGSGDVSGPGSSTDRAIATWNGTGGTDLFNNSTVTISSNGEMVNTAQPAFIARLGSNDLNVTGNGTVYTFGTNTALTEIIDQNGDFNTNGTFTAPVTGLYQISANINMLPASMSGATSFQVGIVTSNRSYLSLSANSGSAEPFRTNLATSLCDMDAADTCTISVLVSGIGADTADLQGGVYNWYSGALIC